MSDKKTPKTKAKKPAATSTEPVVVPTIAAEPVHAPGETPTAAKKSASKPKTKKLSALDAAAKVLAEAGAPMNCTQMIEAMTTKNYWTSANGLTPQATLYAALAREIKTKGAASRFQKAERGHFALNH